MAQHRTPTVTMPERDKIRARIERKDIAHPRWFGGTASCVAVVVSHPFDLIKVRMQMVPPEAKQTLTRTSLAVVRDEGVRGLYSGLSAGLTRALTYGAVRIGVYEELKQQASMHGFGTTSHLLIPIAFASGFAGAILGTPSDIANIRMQNDKSQRPKRPDTIATHLTASLGASLVATSVASPMDVIRTYMMGASSKPGARASLLGVLRHLVSTEGYRWVFRGWSSSFIRLGPQTIATLVTMEQQRKLYQVFIAHQEEIAARHDVE